MYSFFKNIFSIFISILVVFIFNSNTLAQDFEDKVIAKIGDNLIYQSDFENRLNFSPKIGIQDKSKSEGIKKELLYTIIAEKLWINYAIENGLDNEELSLAAKSVIEKMFVRDELYKREIKNKISINPSDFEKALKKNEIILKTKIYFSENEVSIKEFHKNIDKIDQYKNEIKVKDINISFGDLSSELEDQIFILETGEFSNPILNNGVWSIYFVKEKVQNIFYSDKEKNIASKKVYKIISERNENNKYDEFHDRFFNGKKIDVDSKLFNTILSELHKIFKQKFANGLFVKNNNDKYVFFDKVDLKQIKTQLDKTDLLKKFIKFDVNPISLSSFLNDLNVLAFKVPSADRVVIKNKLNSKIKEYIKHELLAREGIRQGLDQSPNVQKWVKIWFENYLFKTIKSQFLSTKGKLYLNNFSISDQNIDDLEIPKNDIDIFKTYIDKTIELSEKYKIHIDNELFSKIKQGNINLYVVRYLGFGGTISGVPTTQPFIEWYLKKEKLSKKYL